MSRSHTKPLSRFQRRQKLGKIVSSFPELPDGKFSEEHCDIYEDILNRLKQNRKLRQNHPIYALEFADICICMMMDYYSVKNSGRPKNIEKINEQLRSLKAEALNLAFSCFGFSESDLKDLNIIFPDKL